jgi:P-type Mg2+ transporter
MGRQTMPFEGFWDGQLQELFRQLQATPTGLTTMRPAGNCVSVAQAPWSGNLASLRYSVFSVSSRIPHHPSRGQCVSLALGEHVGGLIIIAIVRFSVLLNFLMEFQARHAVEEIQKQSAITAALMRGRREQELPIADLVPGQR